MKPTKTATLALITKGNTVLLGLKVKKGADIGEGTLNGPGGKLESGQTLEECMQKEIFEEVGITVSNEQITGTKRAIITFYNGTASVWEVHVYMIPLFDGEPRDSAEMIALPQGWWHAIDTLPFERMLPADREWLPRVLSGEEFSANLYLSDDGALIRSEYQEL